MERTHHLKSLNKAQEGQTVIVQGWIHRLRNLGKLAFIDLRDQYGIVQIVTKPEQIRNLSLESVIAVEGVLKRRKKLNPRLLESTAEIEAQSIRIISKAKTLPFVIDDDLKANEETRLKYRYLDLRRPALKKRILERAQINQIIRNFLVRKDFVEIETPFLTRSTPEGARDFLVPSRLKPKHFYALPQSPQLLKQLLMVANFDRYFQIVRSFRDEDLRLDRQPEFSQLDLEMAFAEPEDVMDIVEKLIKNVFQKLKGKNFSKRFKRITYEQALNTYGTDKPDLRFNLPLIELPQSNSLSREKAVNKVGQSLKKAIISPRILSPSEIKVLEEAGKQHHLAKLKTVDYRHGEWSDSLKSILSDREKEFLKGKLAKNSESTILIAFGDRTEVIPALGAIRNHLGKILNLIPPNSFQILWVTDFPLYEWSKVEKRYVSAHNPFTMPHQDSLQDFDRNFEKSKARSFDLVINGYEIGSGAQRITNPDLQKRMFEALNLDSKEIKNNFEWFTDAYQYGAPYHSGIGLGLDRLAMILSDASSIREVIAFPKNATGHDLMMESPTKIKPEQLKDLEIKFFKPR